MTPVPREPSEFEKQNLSHIPFQPWYTSCVKGKAQAEPHKRTERIIEDSELPVIQCDYLMLKDTAGTGGLKVLSMYVRTFGYGMSTVVETKGPTDSYATTWAVKMLNFLGLSDIILQCDPEIKWAESVKSKRTERTVIRSRSASLGASSPRTRTRSRSPAPLPKRAPRAPRRSSSVASVRGSVALAESGLVTGLATKRCPPVPPPQLRLSRVARALHAASTESQPPAVASGPSAPTARATESSSNSDDEWDALLDAHGLAGTAAAVAQPAVAAGASRRAREKRRRRQRKAAKRSMWRRFVCLLTDVFTLVGLLWFCARFRGSCRLAGPRSSSCGFGCLWSRAAALARSLVQLPVRLPCALCGVLRW